MPYQIKEIFFTLQGEGAQTGCAAVFCRFTGCNLWSGLERDRQEARCNFCDTDFVGTDGVGGGKFANAEAVANAVAAEWPATSEAANIKKLVVCTGGEPLLQLDEALVSALHKRSFKVAIETNGTQLAPAGIDWICVSPKSDTPLVLTSGDELKLVFPQEKAPPERFQHLTFQHFFLQPMDGPEQEKNTQLAVEYCMSNPQWRLSLQTHKLLGIP